MDSVSNDVLIIISFQKMNSVLLMGLIRVSYAPSEESWTM